MSPKKWRPGVLHDGGYSSLAPLQRRHSSSDMLTRIGRQQSVDGRRGARIGARCQLGRAAGKDDAVVTLLIKSRTALVRRLVISSASEAMSD
jgi:hypothetical protein